jgi:hypothetical protein
MIANEFNNFFTMVGCNLQHGKPHLP